jgi:hypothetical protein
MNSATGAVIDLIRKNPGLRQMILVDFEKCPQTLRDVVHNFADDLPGVDLDEVDWIEACHQVRAMP